MLSNKRLVPRYPYLGVRRKPSPAESFSIPVTVQSPQVTSQHDLHPPGPRRRAPSSPRPECHWTSHQG